MRLRCRGLVARGAGKAGGEDLERRRRGARHRRGDRARIDSARDERADRHVGKLVLLDRAQQLARGSRSIHSASETPRSTFSRAVQKRRTPASPLGADVEHVPGLERAHLAEDGARRKRVAEAEEIVDAVLVEIELVVREARAAR